MESAVQLLPTVERLPSSPIEGLEPLLTIEQLCTWLGYSRSTVQKARLRTDHPLPTLGTIAGPRFLPTEVLGWMREEYVRSSAAA